MLGINVYNDDGSLFLEPYIIMQVAELKIGVIGICCDIIGKTMPKHFSEGLKITTGAEELSLYVKKLRSEGADLVILLSHNGFPQDYSMLQNVPGIDICLCAHTHNRMYDSVVINNAILIQCGCHGSFVGHLELHIEDKRIGSHTYNLLKVDKNIPPDPEIELMITNVMAPYEKLKKTIVGRTENILHRYDTLNSSMDDLLLCALKHVSNCDIAFSNGWRYGVPINTGEITEFDLHNIIPMNPSVSIVELSGKEIIEMLEDNLERTFSTETLNQMGGYVKRCSGLRVNMRIENPMGHRIQEIYFGDKTLNLNHHYKVVFVTSQGVPEHLGRNRIELKIKAVEAMKDFFKTNPGFFKPATKTFYLV
jgi:S-sulfosulfanyl-L-cysteine sulfohydrolase